MHATIRRMGTKDVVATATLKDGRVVIDRAVVDVKAALAMFFASTHVVRWRDERDAPRERALAPGGDEHFALRLEALPAIGFYADDVRP